MMVLIAASAFVGTHFLMSHPLRAPLVSRLGEKGFLGLYSLVAAITLIWMIVAYRAAPVTPMLWPVGDLPWALATLIMLIASILLLGSLVGNPAMPNPDGAMAVPAEAAANDAAAPVSAEEAGVVAWLREPYDGGVNCTGAVAPPTDTLPTGDLGVWPGVLGILGPGDPEPRDRAPPPPPPQATMGEHR